jgi:hypothetical protein
MESRGPQNRITVPKKVLLTRRGDEAEPVDAVEPERSERAVLLVDVSILFGFLKGTA